MVKQFLKRFFKNMFFTIGVMFVIFFLFMAIISSLFGGDCVRSCDDKGKCKRECGAGHCVDADDWGFPKLYVSAQEKDLIVQREPVLNQYARAIDSGQVLISSDEVPLIITVGKYDEWSSWFGGDINPTGSGGKKDPNGYDGGRTVPNKECIYDLPPGKTSPPDGTTPVFGLDLSPGTFKIRNNSTVRVTSPVNKPSLNIVPDNYADNLVPCRYRYGMGLYVGFAPDSGSASSDTDVILTYHIPDSHRPDYAYDKGNHDTSLQAQALDGYLVRGLPKDELPGAQTGDRLFFKIVDRTYMDNTGGYHVKIKEGTKSPEPGLFSSIAAAFIDPLKIIMARIYNGIVQNQDYINVARLLLALSIAFYGFVFMTSAMEGAKKQAFDRVLKMAVIFTLISPGSYQFFYNYLFSIFFDGAQTIAGLVMNPTGDFDPANPWYTMDRLIAKLWSGETWAKISSTLFSNFLGLPFIASMFLAIGLLMYTAFKAMIVYLTAFGGMALLVIIAPIILLLMLFEKTKDIALKEWFNQFAVFAMQQIILMAAIGLFSTLILGYMEKIIGYNTCWNIYFTLGIPGFIDIWDFKFWMPDISNDQANLWLDVNGDGIREWVTRYVDLPYFDPIFDKDQIDRYMSEKDFISAFDILMLLMLVYLMLLFMDIVPDVANALKSTSPTDSSNMMTAGKGGGFDSRGGILGGGAKDGTGLLGAGAQALSGLNEARENFKKFRNSEHGRYVGRGIKNFFTGGDDKKPDAAKPDAAKGAAVKGAAAKGAAAKGGADKKSNLAASAENALGEINKAKAGAEFTSEGHEHIERDQTDLTKGHKPYIAGGAGLGDKKVTRGATFGDPQMPQLPDIDGDDKEYGGRSGIAAGDPSALPMDEVGDDARAKKKEAAADKLRGSTVALVSSKLGNDFRISDINSEVEEALSQLTDDEILTMSPALLAARVEAILKGK